MSSKLLSRFVSLSNGTKYLLKHSLVKQQFRLATLTTSIDKSKLRYTDKHEWISLVGNVGVVGITDYAQDKLGEVVYIELPEVGAKFNASEQFATLESVKAVSECYLPAGGSVVEINESLKENPSQINKSPFDQGWLVKVEITNKDELNKLMNENQYNEYLKSEDH